MANPKGMGNRSSSPGRDGQPPDRPPPGWRVHADPVSRTVPQRPARDRSWRPRRQPAPDPSIPVTPAGIRLRRDRPPGGTALDGLVPTDIDEPVRSGWRDLIQRVSGIDLGPGKGATYEAALRDQIRTPVGGAVPIAVLNLKGGVGKTAVVEALGSTFADARDDRTIAVDIDGGDLVDRHGRRAPLNLVDLVTERVVTRYTDVRAHTYLNSFGLEVLGLPDYAHANWRLERRDVAKALSILKNHYSIILVDCAKELKSTAMEAVLSESRALVVVGGVSIDAMRKTRTTLDWLSNNGYRRLVGSTVLAVNHVASSKLEIVAAKELEELSARVAATVVLPFDGHIHEGTEIGLDRLSRDSRRCYLELAAALAATLPSRGVERGARPEAAQLRS